MKRIGLPLISLSAALALDVLTKAWAERTLTGGQSVPIVGQFLRWTLGHNTGLAFGLFAGDGRWLLIFTGLVILSLAVLLPGAVPNAKSPVARWPIGLIIGGAIANFVDRLPDGRVTDFLDIGLGPIRWPTFNVADSLIVLGVAVLGLNVLRAGHATDLDARNQLTGDQRVAR